MTDDYCITTQTECAIGP